MSEPNIQRILGLIPSLPLISKIKSPAPPHLMRNSHLKPGLVGTTNLKSSTNAVWHKITMEM
jgi:hypothetical protein